MTLVEVFEKERARYVELLLDARADIVRASPATSSEVLISISNEAMAYPYRYLRVDVMSKDADGAVRPFYVHGTIDAQFEQTAFAHGSCGVEVFPFTWDAVQVGFDRPFAAMQELEAWMTQALDVDDKHADQLLAQAAHSFTRVEHHGQWWYLTADLGSAPATVLIEFIDLLSANGMGHVVIQSPETPGGNG